MIFSPYPVVILKTELKVKVNGDQDMMFSPYPANILGHIFALLALNWIAHLLHHILTPAISYKHPLTYSLQYLFVYNGRYLELVLVRQVLPLVLTCQQWWSGIPFGTSPQRWCCKQPDFHQSIPPLQRRGKPSQQFRIIVKIVGWTSQLLECAVPSLLVISLRNAHTPTIKQHPISPLYSVHPLCLQFVICLMRRNPKLEVAMNKD